MSERLHVNPSEPRALMSVVGDTDSSQCGVPVLIAGDTGVADSLQVYLKKADDTYAWYTFDLTEVV